MAEIPHIITAAPFTPVNMEPIFLRAAELKELALDPNNKRVMAAAYLGRTAANIFYQESTRTRSSFELAEAKWGIDFSSTPNARLFSSAAKGESLEHTIQVFNEYDVDFIVLRYDEAGGAKDAAEVSQVPIINAGDGRGEHPTQAFLDAYTIWEQLGRLDNLRITFMGDLRFGRTIRSLVHVLSKTKNNHFDFVSTPDLSLSDDIKKLLDNAELSYNEHTSAAALESILPETDVFYVTRTQTNQGATTVNTGEFQVTKERADLLPPRAIIMHPMPIDREDPLLSEIAPEVDSHPRAKYFRQAGNGLYVRMALIEALMEERPILA